VSKGVPEIVCKQLLESMDDVIHVPNHGTKTSKNSHKKLALSHYPKGSGCGENGNLIERKQQKQVQKVLIWMG
jgi:hypothetical protein